MDPPGSPWIAPNPRETLANWPDPDGSPWKHENRFPRESIVIHPDRTRNQGFDPIQTPWNQSENFR